jgi:hypothetical protein
MSANNGLNPVPWEGEQCSGDQAGNPTKQQSKGNSETLTLDQYVAMELNRIKSLKTADERLDALKMLELKLQKAVSSVQKAKTNLLKDLI